jgi:NCAIR mutase (PurE)-related protein
MYKQAVVRLCQGAADKEAGSYASNIRPKNIEEAIDKMRWFQHNNQAIFGTTLGRNPRREVKQVSPGPHYGGEARVCAIGTDRVTDKSLEKTMGEVLSAQGKEMSEIKSNIAALSTQMAVIMPSRITPKGGPKYSLIIMLEPPHFINSLLYVFRSDIRGITPGLFIYCPLA